MSANTVDFRLNRGPGESSRQRSPNIWYDCPILDIVEGNRNGVFFRDDFVDFPLAGVLTTQAALGTYKAFGSTGSTITKPSTFNSVEVPGGAAELAVVTNDLSASIAHAFPTFLISGSTANSGKLWFECCVAQNGIGVDRASSIFGLAETEQFTLANTVPLNGGDAFSNAGAFLGFQVTEDGLGAVNAGYTDRGTSLVNAVAGIGTLAANTFAKFGFVYDPYSYDAGQCIKWYFNNLQVGQTSKAVLTGTTNLKANALGFIWAMAADTAGTTSKNWMKWWSCAQVFEPLG